MSYSGQSGAIYFGPQSAKGVIATTFYRYPATDIDFDAISPGGVLPPEIAGILTPRGAYKMGVFAAGGFSFIPRLDGDLGWLLLGLFGNVDSTFAQSAAIMDYVTVDSDLDTDLATWYDTDGQFTQMSVPRMISFTRALVNPGDFTVFVTGTLPGGQVTTETINMSANGDTSSTVNAYLSLTSVTVVTADEGGTFAIGWNPYVVTNSEGVLSFIEGTGVDQTILPLALNHSNLPVAIRLAGYMTCVDGDLDSDWSITVNGTNAEGLTISEVIVPTGAARTASLTTEYFKTITSIVLDSDFDSDQYGGVGYNGVNLYSHFFTYAPDQEVIDWMTIRKVIPGDTDYFCEVLDCKLAMARFIVPQAGPVAARIDAVGRVPSFPEDVQATWDSEADADDDPDVFPIANATGFFKITDKEGNIDSLGVTGMIFEIVNLLTTPQEEMTVGSNYPDDFGVRGRAVTCRFVYRWKDPELCRQIMTGASSGETAWTAEVFTTDVEAEVTVPGEAGSDTAPLLNEPYRLRFSAPRVEFRQNGPLRLVGNQTIAVEFIGSVLTPEGSGQAVEGGDGDYFAVELWNQLIAYTWP